MSEDIRVERFDSDEAFDKFLSSLTDDIDAVQILVPNGMQLVSDIDGKSIECPECCAVLKTCTGASWVLNRHDLERILNQGVLHRRSIPIQLSTE